MATMIPENVERFTTDGEKQSYCFLEAVAKPDEDYLCWYLPDVLGEEPDFILFSNDLGLVVFEVKDWNLNQIREANPHYFKIIKGNRTEQHQNPYRQARNYLYNIIDKIKEDGFLVSKELKHRGNPKIPINYGVIFPNINKYEYCQRELNQVIRTDKIFFWDDLHPDSPICCDSTGVCFLKVMTNRFTPKFSFNLTGVEIDHLKQLIFPIIRIELPKRESDFPYEERICRLKGLDNHQESIARKFDGGHRIIRGPSGSGKTLILVHKAIFLLKYSPGIKNILFVCFNITLVNYIKRLLADKGAPLGESGVQVFHFYELCSEILSEDVAYENESSEYYEVIDQETLSKVHNFGNKYDAILVDEGQDFSDNMYKIVTALLNERTNNLTIALDDNQEIYRRKSSWRKVGVEARGRVHNISYIYRNTKEISDFASKFIEEDVFTDEDKKPKQLELFPDFFDFRGPKPELKQFENLDSVTEYVSKTIAEIVSAEEYPFSEIAIIYCKKSIDDKDIQIIPKMFKSALNSKGVLCNWASENYHSKKSYDITTNSVTISTIHSTKGFDYACVFLVGLDLLEEDGWSKEQITNMTYVAITRARYQLFIPYIYEIPLISRLNSCL